MNFSSLFGVVLAGVVFIFALHETDPNLKRFLDFHSFVTVIGGTAAAACISFPVKKVILLLKIFMLRVLGKKNIDYQQVIEQILELSKKATIGISALNEALPTIKHEFLKEAVQLVSSGVLTEKEIRHTLEMRVETVETEFMHDANMFRNIGKFPPAFGLMATTLGMIALLAKLAEPDSQKLIGPAMSIGLIGTLYGITLANLVFVPIAENLTERTHEEVRLRKMIIEGAVMLKAQTNPIAMREGLNSFLLPKDRVVRKSAA